MYPSFGGLAHPEKHAAKTALVLETKAGYLVDALGGNVGLLELCLAHNGLARPAGVERFLIANITLRELDLSGTPRLKSALHFLDNL